MREINLTDVTNAVKKMLIEACYYIPCNVLESLKKAYEKEESSLGKEIIQKIIEKALCVYFLSLSGDLYLGR